MHLLDQRHGFMLVAPSPCRAVVAEILTEQAIVAREELTRHEPAALVNRDIADTALAPWLNETRGRTVTLEGPDGYRYLVSRDGSLVTEGGMIRLDDLTPESAAIVRALIDAHKDDDGRAARDDRHEQPGP